MDFEIVPPVTIVVGYIVFVNELLGKLFESDVYVLKLIKGGAKIEVFYVKTQKFGIAYQQHTVNDELDNIK